MWLHREVSEAMRTVWPWGREGELYVALETTWPLESRIEKTAPESRWGYFHTENQKEPFEN